MRTLNQGQAYDTKLYWCELMDPAGQSTYENQQSQT